MSQLYYPARHSDLPDAGQTPHLVIDENLPTEREKAIVEEMADSAPITVSGARNDPEQALADLLAALEALGLITDGTTAT